MRGDPGFFGTLFGGIKGAISGGIRGFVGAPTAPPRQFFAPPQQQGRFSRRQGLVPAVKGFFSGPPRPGIPGFMGPEGEPRRRRRMNAGNAKALRRAIRRTDAFVRLSRSALKNTGFKIVSKSSGKMTEAAWQKKAHHAK